MNFVAGVKMLLAATSSEQNPQIRPLYIKTPKQEEMSPFQAGLGGLLLFLTPFLTFIVGFGEKTVQAAASVEQGEEERSPDLRSCCG